MDEQIRQIGERIRGLRDALDLSVEDMAGQCGLPVEQYKQIESGECDIAVSTLQQIGRKCNVPLDVLMFGEPVFRWSVRRHINTSRWLQGSATARPILSW